MSYDKPLPKIDELNRGFWDNARAGILSVQHCKACGDTRYPPSPVCPKCLSPDQDWLAVSGKGTLESWVDFHRAYWDGFKVDLPYRVCLVRLVNCPADEPTNPTPRTPAAARRIPGEAGAPPPR